MFSLLAFPNGKPPELRFFTPGNARSFAVSSGLMTMQILTVGSEQTRVVVIDNLVQDPDGLVGEAAHMAPFPPVEGNFYPGVRRVITPDDGLAFDYAQAIFRTAAPLIGRTYGVGELELIEAGFSLVTTPAEALHARQSRPHVDAYDAGYFAILHYLSRRPSGGTGFYRHVRTGFETLLPDRVAAYDAGRARDEKIFGAPAGYVSGDSEGFTQVAKVDARFNRAAIYPGNLLHSGLLPNGFDFSPDPRFGRLTANFLLRVRT